MVTPYQLHGVIAEKIKISIIIITMKTSNVINNFSLIYENLI